LKQKGDSQKGKREHRGPKKTGWFKRKGEARRLGLLGEKTN